MKKRSKSEHRARENIKEGAEVRAAIKTGHYEHTQRRAHERANMELSREVYDGWIRRIRNNRIRTYLAEGDTNRITLHRVEHEGIELVAVYDRRLHVIQTVYRTIEEASS